jgi:hypothetical protein
VSAAREKFGARTKAEATRTAHAIAGKLIASYFDVGQPFEESHRDGVPLADAERLRDAIDRIRAQHDRKGAAEGPQTMSATKMDRHDLALLRSLSASRFRFPKTSARELRAALLWRSGHLDRSFDVYRTSAGGGSIESRFAYKLTDRGEAAVKAADVAVTS